MLAVLAVLTVLAGATLATLLVVGMVRVARPGATTVSPPAHQAAQTDSRATALKTPEMAISAIATSGLDQPLAMPEAHDGTYIELPDLKTAPSKKAPRRTTVWTTITRLFSKRS